MKKVVLAGVLGGLTMFIWSFISHVLLPVGEMGLSALPAANEEAVVSAMKSNIQAPGLYFIPGFDSHNDSPEAQKAYQEKYQAGPTAFMVYHPTGEQPMSPAQLIRELLFNIACGLIAAYIASLTAATLGTRALIVMLMGFFAWLSISASHWNWYRFPSKFVLGEGIDEIVGWLSAGLVIGWIQTRRSG